MGGMPADPAPADLPTTDLVLTDPGVLTDRIPAGTAAGDPDALYEVFAGWAQERGTPLYPHQDESVLHLLDGSNLVLSTPTGSGKSLVATAAILVALAGQDGASPGAVTPRVSFYTAPIKALVSEKFFDLCRIFGADNVGMLTGDASVNADAPVIVCTAEVLANIALREGADADVGMVVMDEFHFYTEPGRGWAWQVPLIELPGAQFLLMSATLGDVTFLREDLTRVAAYARLGSEPHCGCCLDHAQSLIDDERGKRPQLRVIAA